MLKKIKLFNGFGFDPSNPEHRPPYIKGRGFCPNPRVIYGIPKYADSLSDPKVIGTPEYIEFWEEELRRIHNGYQTGGWWVPGRYYYYLNYSVMQDNKGGSINPDVDDLHMELAYLIEYCKTYGKNLMIPKARRKGISEATHKMVIDYGWRFTYNYKAGIASGKKDFIDDFVKKLRYGWMHLPPEFYTNPQLNNDDEIIAGFQEKNHLNSYVQAGTMNTIYTRTVHTDATGFKGNYYRDIVVEEIGETEKFLEFWRGTKSALTDGVGNQVGSAFCYGCVCAGTKVWDNYGNLVNIEDLKYENGIVGFNSSKGEISKEFISYWQPPAEKICYKITTNTGRILECSEDHPILLRDKWKTNKTRTATSWKKTCSFKEAKDVSIGDNVATIESVDIWSNKRMFEPRIVGWAVGDGTYGVSKGNCFNITMANADEEMYKYISSKYETRVDYEAPTKDGRTLRKFRINGVYLKDSFRELGIVGQTKMNKRLPKDIHSYCKKDVCEFIGGYFDADGCIYTNNDTKETFLKLTSIVYDILDEMRFILQKLGIRSNIMYEKGGKSTYGSNGHYNLIIKDNKSILCFYNNIKFSILKKQKNFKRAIKNISNAKYSRGEAVKGLRFECVKSVECIGMKPIYNLTAANTNTYIANGIVTHNTGGNMDKGSKDFKKAWSRNEKENFIDTNNFIRFLIPAQRFNMYGGASDVNRRIPKDSKLLKEYQSYQLIGVEDVESSLARILKDRAELIKQSDKKDYYEHLQNEPINEQEIFAKTIVNNFDSEKISKQLSVLDNQTHPKWTKHKLSWVKDDKGLTTMQVKADVLEYGDNEENCVWILDDGHPVKNFESRYAGGIDGYNVDQSKNSKSLGGMCVIDRVTKTPVAVICCRPARKEMFYEMCIQLSIYYRMYGNVLGDIGSDSVMKHFELFGCYQYLADRPKKFESLGSEQMHVKWVRLTDYSKPKMIGLMQAHVIDHCDKIWFPELLSQISSYDEGARDSDNDLADAYGIALMQDLSFEIAPRDNEANDVPDRFALPKFKDGRIVQEAGTLKNIQQDSALFGMMFGKPD